MNFNSFSFLIMFIVFMLIFSLCVFIPTLSEYGYISSYVPNEYSNYFDINSSYFIWPTPGYTTITSNFGPRRSPTTGRLFLSLWYGYWRTYGYKHCCYFFR